ncbi:MAG: DnaJ C-terminal domain-containing protein [Rhizobiaceae bacterium]|nr:DnaJ C-terminal domain-containing protein [Rhizobiaceae bacterium]
MANPYSVLGVPKGADEKAIKSAFRKLAKKFHPDQNPDNRSAQAKFAEVNQAYEILGDKEKRAQFDRGEIDDNGQPKFAGFAGGDPFGGARPGGAGGGDPFGGGGFGGAEDILNEMFGSAFGGSRSAAGGNPFGNMGGMGGQRSRTKPPSLDIEIKASVTIDDLMRGKAKVKMPDGKQISVSIPAEAENRQVIRLKGKGKSAPGRHPGDALITLLIRTDTTFERFGADLRCTAEVPLETAVLGGKIPVKTVDGKLSLNIPEGTSSGKVFRLKNKGLPKKAGGYGDLLVVASLQLPEEKLADLKKFFST